METMRAHNAGRALPYPLYIKLAGQKVVVVGAGAVAARKITSFIECGADVTVIADRPIDEVVQLAETGAIHLESRPYREGDLEGAILAVAATSDHAVNEAISAEAKERTILVNVVDTPGLCNCIVPSVLKRGRLQIAVSTDGAAPCVAQEVREDLEDYFPQWWEPYIDLLAEVRCLVKERVEGPASIRTRIFESLATSDIKTRIAAGEDLDAESVYQGYVVPLIGGEDA